MRRRKKLVRKRRVRSELRRWGHLLRPKRRSLLVRILYDYCEGARALRRYEGVQASRRHVWTHRRDLFGRTIEEKGGAEGG